MTSGFDIQAARYCANLTASHYKQAGIELPQQIRDHLRQLEGHSSSVVGTETSSGTAESNHGGLINTDAAAQLLSCSPRYIRRIATDLDGTKPDGRHWLFNRDIVTEYREAKAERT